MQSNEQEKQQPKVENVEVINVTQEDDLRTKYKF